MHDYARENKKKHQIVGIMAEEGGQRAINGKCQTFKKGKLSFHPLIKITKEWEQWFIDKYNIQLCELYYPPYNFERTGCKGCPFSLNLQKNLTQLSASGLEYERRICEQLWKPIYDEYRRIGYRLEKEEQTKLL